MSVLYNDCVFIMMCLLLLLCMSSFPQCLYVVSFVSFSSAYFGLCVSLFIMHVVCFFFVCLSTLGSCVLFLCVCLRLCFCVWFFLFVFFVFFRYVQSSFFSLFVVSPHVCFYSSLLSPVCLFFGVLTLLLILCFYSLHSHFPVV